MNIIVKGRNVAVKDLNKIPVAIDVSYLLTYAPIDDSSNT